MKICIITSWFPSFKCPNLGTFVEKYASDLVTYGGLDVSIITVLRNGDNRNSRNGNVKITRIKGKFPLLSVHRIIDRIKPDIIHIHAPNVFSSTGIIVGKIKSIPIIATVYRAEVDSTGKFLSFMRRLSLANCARIVTASNFTRDLAIKSGADPNKILIIHNSCDESLFRVRNKIEARTLCNLPLDKKIILYVGNIIEIKGIDILIKGLKILLSFDTDFVCLLIGKGEEKEKLKKFVNELDLGSKVRFLDWTPPNMLSNYYCAADVFVLPSKVEGQSVALLEAMACGVPAVASNIGGNRVSISHGINGLLFESQSEIELAKDIAMLLSDHKLASKLSENSKRVYHEKFSTDLQISRYIEIYKALSKT